MAKRRQRAWNHSRKLIYKEKSLKERRGLYCSPFTQNFRKLRLGVSVREEHHELFNIYPKSSDWRAAVNSKQGRESQKAWNYNEICETCKWNTNFDLERATRKNTTHFQNFHSSGKFSGGISQTIEFYFTSQPVFPGIFGKWTVNNQGPYLPSVHWNIELK